MKQFRRGKKKTVSCLNCKLHTIAMNEPYCAKDFPLHVDLRYLSIDSIRRKCKPLSGERICPDYQLAVLYETLH